MTELTKRLRTHAEYADVITPIAEDMLKAADEIERLRGKRPRGGWEIIGNEFGVDCIRCSRCGVRRFGQKENYCPNCGADMWGIENE